MACVPCRQTVAQLDSIQNMVALGDFNESIGVNPVGMASVMTAGHLRCILTPS
jgi:hypothetical protein